VTGTLQAVLGTNPLTLAAPGKKDNFVLDMATSAVAIGKVMDKLLAVLHCSNDACRTGLC